MSVRGLVTKISIKADAQGNAPTSIELLRTGDWHTMWHGDFEVTLPDLHEYAANFGKGVGLVEGDKRAPINYAHESWDKAAGWITGLSIDEARGALVASVEWTTEGAQALRDGEWAYISPEFNPRGCPYQDPEGSDDEYGVPVFINNVLTGAGLTNIPLFKKLKPIMASRVPTKKKASAKPGNGDKHNQGESSMTVTLEEIRAKQAADLTEDDKTFLNEHKSELTDDERTTFGLVDESEAPVVPAPTAEPTEVAEPAAPVEASAKGVSITADRLAKLEADATLGRKAMAELEHKKADEFVSASVKAGQIKSGDKDRWITQLLASSGDHRSDLEALLTGLPKNDNLEKELGDGGTDVKVEASVEVDKQVRKVQADARAAGKTIAYSAARKQVLDADANLKSQLAEEEN